MVNGTAIYRVDKFIVPETVRDEFLRRVGDAHELLRRQLGFVRDAVLSQTDGPGRYNVVTIVEWENQAAVDAATVAVAAAYRERGFNPAETLARLGIEADSASYKPVGT